MNSIPATSENEASYDYTASTLAANAFLLANHIPNLLPGQTKKNDSPCFLTGILFSQFLSLKVAADAD